MHHADEMNNPTANTITAVVLLGTLAACGGGGGSGVSPVDPVRSPPIVPAPDQEAGQMNVARNALLSSYANPVVFTNVSDVPIQGGATYEGYLSGDLSDTTDNITDALIGQINMDVNFTRTSVQITGRVDNIFSNDNSALSGSLVLSDSSLDRNGNPQNDATLLLLTRGTLTDDQGQVLDVSAQLEGDFLGESHNAVAGEVLGRVTVNGTVQNIDGSFIAER